MKKNNPLYAKIFTKIAEASTDTLIITLAMLRRDLHSLSPERLLVYSCIFDYLEDRIGEEELGNMIDRLDAVV